jgi:talin
MTWLCFFFQPADKLVASSKSALPTVMDQASQMQLSNASKQMASAVTDLTSAVHRARDACRALELDAAIEMIRGLDRELVEFQNAVESNTLRPLPGETVSRSLSDDYCQSNLHYQ